MKDYLKGKTVYLCGAMAALQDSGVQWRDWITQRLKTEFSMIVLDPTGKSTDGISEIGDDKEKFRDLCKREAWGELKDTFYDVVRWDLRAVDKADVIIVNYDTLVPTVGTWHEIEVANFERKPILMKYDTSQLDTFNPWVTVHMKPEHLFSDWEILFNHLRDVNNGKFNRRRWTL